MIIIIIIFIFSFFFFYCKDYFNLKKILNIIVYFQLNPNLVKKFLNQKKRENKTHLKKIKNIAVVNNHKIKNKSKIIIFNRVKKANLKSLNKKISNVKLKNKDIFGESYNKFANPNKKKKKIGKIINNIMNFNNIVSSKKAFFNKKIFQIN